ncbi:unnamed protein product [Diplocarpon coronariae]
MRRFLSKKSMSPYFKDNQTLQQTQEHSKKEPRDYNKPRGPLKALEDPLLQPKVRRRIVFGQLEEVTQLVSYRLSVRSHHASIEEVTPPSSPQSRPSGYGRLEPSARPSKKASFRRQLSKLWRSEKNPHQLKPSRKTPWELRGPSVQPRSLRKLSGGRRPDSPRPGFRRGGRVREAEVRNRSQISPSRSGGYHAGIPRTQLNYFNTLSVDGAPEIPARSSRRPGPSPTGSSGPAPAIPLRSPLRQNRDLGSLRSQTATSVSRAYEKSVRRRRGVWDLREGVRLDGYLGILNCETWAGRKQ